MAKARQPLSLLALRALELVIRTGSMTEAARKLFVTRPAVGQLVRKLEQQLGSSLVERRGRGVVATAEGLRVAGVAADVFGRIETAARHLQREVAQRKVTCYCEASVAGTWLASNWKVFSGPAAEGRLVFRTFATLELVPGDATLIISSSERLPDDWTMEALFPSSSVLVRHRSVAVDERRYASPGGAAATGLHGSGGVAVALAFARSGIGRVELPLYAAVGSLLSGTLQLERVEARPGQGLNAFVKQGKGSAATREVLDALRAKASDDMAAFGTHTEHLRVLPAPKHASAPSRRSRERTRARS